MFWFDKNNPHVLYCDNREFDGELCDGRQFTVQPDVLCDFRQLPFADESFWHVVFDPPHVTNAGEKSWMAKKYGRHCLGRQPYIKAGFEECWRVLKPNGTLVFKWAALKVTAGEIINAIGREPLYGQKERKNGNTHWMCFLKTESGESA